MWYEENFIELANKFYDKKVFDYVYLICGKGSQKWSFSAGMKNSSTERDSDANALRSDVFWFNEAQAFWQFGFTFQQEDAQDNTFDYTSYLADVAYTTPLTWLHKDTEFTLSYHYETRDYAGAREGGIGRNDNRQRIKAVIDYPVSRHVDVMLSTQYGNYSSTTDSADYKETLAELGMKLYF